MFLRATKRFKDGKVHDYWSMVENTRERSFVADAAAWKMFGAEIPNRK